MTRLKDLLTALVLLAVGGVSLAAAARVVRQPLPVTPAAPPLELRAWLLERDLSKEAPETRARVARRFEQEFLNDRRLLAELRDLKPEQRQNVQANILQLLEPMFVEKALEYHRQPERRRQRFLDRELDRLLNLAGPQRGSQVEAAAMTQSGMAILAMLNQQIETWVERAEPEQQPQLREYAAALQNRWFARQTERMIDQP